MRSDIKSKHFFVLLSFLVYLQFMSFKVYSADNLLVVSIDGLRWQEVFRGFDQGLMDDPEITEQAGNLEKRFGANTQAQRRQKLMPFLWSTVATNGLLMGNLDVGSPMLLTNHLWFSYPGYNELLTGRADPTIDSNKSAPNPNESFLEWLNKQAAFKNRVAAFGSWDVFPAILNTQRSKLMVNAGFMPADWENVSVKARWLNELQKDIPSPWHNVRLDAFTHGFAQAYISAKRPKVIYLALGETDDFAHDGEYHQYLQAAHRSDQFIASLWQTLQNLPQYRDNTNLIITVDHGRGSTKKTWQHHGSAEALRGYLKTIAEDSELGKTGVVGSDQVWLAAMGPDVPASGELTNTATRYLNQVAATALALLEQEPQQFAKNIGKVLPEVVEGEMK